MPRLATWCCLAFLAAPCLSAAQSAPDHARLQRAVERSMAGRSGAAVVLDVASGRILAQYRLETAARRLAHPGSTVKPFVLLALLESGKLDPAFSLACPGKLRLGEHRMDCSHAHTGEALTASTALAYSCNSYFAQVATRFDARELSEALSRAGLASPTGLFPREATGLIRPAANLEQLQLQALGEAGIEVTPLELLAAYRKLALRRRDPAPLSPALVAVFEGLEGSTAYGMGRAARPEGLEVAGKTGTAAAAEGRWTHAWFAGYAPARAPEIALVVFLERGRGSLDAAGAAHEIFAAYGAATHESHGASIPPGTSQHPVKLSSAPALPRGGP